MKIYKNAYFERFAKKNKIADTDLIKAVERVEKGLIDADLGSFLIKQRIPRKGQSRARGYRTMLSVYRISNVILFMAMRNLKRTILLRLKKESLRSWLNFFRLCLTRICKS